MNPFVSTLLLILVIFFGPIPIRADSQDCWRHWGVHEAKLQRICATGVVLVTPLAICEIQKLAAIELLDSFFGHFQENVDRYDSLPPSRQLYGGIAVTQAID